MLHKYRDAPPGPGSYFSSAMHSAAKSPKCMTPLSKIKESSSQAKLNPLHKKKSLPSTSKIKLKFTHQAHQSSRQRFTGSSKRVEMVDISNNNPLSHALSREPSVEKSLNKELSPRTPQVVRKDYQEMTQMMHRTKS